MEGLQFFKIKARGVNAHPGALNIDSYTFFYWYTKFNDISEFIGIALGPKVPIY